jgi:acyl-CoA synthetase (AMP-forming)/AMP-acid ligase II
LLLGDFVDFAARRAPDRTAIRFEERAFTFSEYKHRVDRLSDALLGLGNPGDRVGILSGNTSEYVEAYYGVPMAGMALTLVNPRLVAREVAYILSDAEVGAVFVQPEHLHTIRQIRDQVPSLRHVIAFGEEVPEGADLAYEPLLAAAKPQRPKLEISDHDMAWLIYTSGTTGRPKGAMLSHRNLVASVTNALMCTQPERYGVYIMPFPLAHVAGHVSPTFLARDITLIIQRAFDPEDYVRTVAEHGVTGSPMAPAMLGLILARPELDGYDVSSVRKLFYGASSISPELLRRSMERFSNARFYQGFGMTELGGNPLYMDPETHLRGAGEEPHLLAGAGYEAPYSSVRIVDDDLNDLPVGEIGEIIVKGDQVMSGYWRNEEATREAIVDGWMRTGDMGRMDENRLFYIVDRKKDMIVTGGENVYSREVEDVLAEHPAVQDVAVIGIPAETWGENVCAIVVKRPGEDVDEDGLVAHCRASLASYKKPKLVVFVDELPRNPSGKVLKRELRERYAVAAPAG